MKMYQLVEWFQVNYPQRHHDLLQCNHNFDETNLNPYHLESDCWSHTMMVCKIAEISNYDKVVQIAALLHDIGKPAVRNINPRNNHVQFFGHEALSAEMAEEPLEQLIREGLLIEEEKKEVLQLILHHAFLYKYSEAQEILTYFHGDKAFCRHLIQLVRSDSFGRFSADPLDEKKYQNLLNYFGDI